jgi:hypothetical protein
MATGLWKISSICWSHGCLKLKVTTWQPNKIQVCYRVYDGQRCRILTARLKFNKTEYFRPRTDTCNVTCNVMRILRLDVTAIIACNAGRMVRSDSSAGGFFLENKGFGLGSQYTFERLSACMRVWTCVREQGKLRQWVSVCSVWS